MKSFKIILFIIISVFIVFTAKVRSQEYEQQKEFSIAYDVRYVLDQEKNAKVAKKGLITNLQAQRYLPSLTLHFDTTSIESIKAFDEYGVIEPMINKDATSSSVILLFNKPVLGIGKKLNFSIEYTLKNFIPQKNERLIVSLPRIADDPYIVSYNVGLIFPESFGTPQFVDPPIRGKTYFWEKDQLKSRGVTLIFRNDKKNAIVDIKKKSTDSSGTSGAYKRLIIAFVAIASIVIVAAFLSFLKRKN